MNDRHQPGAIRRRALLRAALTAPVDGTRNSTRPQNDWPNPAMTQVLELPSVSRGSGSGRLSHHALACGMITQFKWQVDERDAVATLHRGEWL